MKRELSESSPDEYFDIFSNLVQSPLQWSQLPEIVHLSLKALGKYLLSHNQHQSQIRQQLNQLSLSVNELHLNKASKREVERQFEDMRMMGRHQSPTPSEADERSASVDYKFRRDEGLDRTMIEEVKTIALALIEQRIAHQSQISERKVQQQVSAVVVDLKKELDQTIGRIKDITAKSAQEGDKHRQSKQLNASNSHVQVQIRKLADELKQVKADSAILSKSVLQKLDRDMFEQHVRQLRTRQPQSQYNCFQTEVQGVKKIAQQLLVRKLDQKQFHDFKHKTSKALTQKVKLQEVEEVVKGFQSELINQLNEVRGELKRLEKQLTKQLKKSVETLQLSQVEPKKSRKQTSPSSKKTNSSISEIKSSLHRVEQRIHERLLDMEPSEQNFSEVKGELAKQWQKIQQELEERERKLCQTIEQTLETNRQTVERPSRRPVAKESETELALSVLCKEMVLGKWTCSSSPLKGRLVPWETQIRNTNIENFIWTANDTSILVVAPGLYRLEVGFFSIHRVDLQVLVNGEMALLVYSKEEKRLNRKHPNGCIVGTTAIEVIVMPARGRLSIEAAGATNGQVYLSLAKI